jgi:hypothetical protein
MADSINSARRRKGQREIQWGLPEQIDCEGPVVIDNASKQMDEFNALLPREAAKVAIEYIALVADPSVALDTRLDPLRHWALFGDSGEYYIADYVGKRGVYLPRTGYYHKLDDWGTAVPSHEEQTALVTNPDGTQRGLPPNTVVLRWPVHRLQLWRDSDGGHFEMTLFSWLGVRLPLALQLPVPWGRFDSWDFNRPHSGMRPRGPSSLL